MAQFMALQVNRREFLHRSLGIALGGVLVPYFSTSRQAKAQSKNDRPRLAAIGLGGQGVGIARAAMRLRRPGRLLRRRPPPGGEVRPRRQEPRSTTTSASCWNAPMSTW